MAPVAHLRWRSVAIWLRISSMISDIPWLMCGRACSRTIAMVFSAALACGRTRVMVSIAAFGLWSHVRYGGQVGNGYASLLWFSCFGWLSHSFFGVHFTDGSGSHHQYGVQSRSGSGVAIAFCGQVRLWLVVACLLWRSSWEWLRKSSMVSCFGWLWVANDGW